MDDEKKDEIIKHTFNKYGTYFSLIKDLKLLKYFMEHPNQEIRKKTINEYFSDLASRTLLRHIKNLIKYGIIEKSSKFRGTYKFKPEYITKTQLDMEKLSRAILGDEIFELAISSHIEKEKQLKEDIEDYESYRGYTFDKRKFRQNGRYY